MLSLRINCSGDRTGKTHITNLHCASLDLSHLLVFRDFQQVLSICLFSEDRRAQRLAQARLTFGNPAVGADVHSTSATSVSSEKELYLGRLSCLSRSLSCEKRRSGSVACHSPPPKVLPVVLPWRVVLSPCPFTVSVSSCCSERDSMGCQLSNSWETRQPASHFQMLHMALSIAGRRCRSRRVKRQQAEHLHPVCLISLAMVSAGLC